MTAIRHILCPVDFSEFSRRAVDLAAALAVKHGAQVTAVHVRQPIQMTEPAPPTLAPVPIAPRSERAIHDDLERFLDPARAAGIRVHIETLDGDPSIEIAARAEALAADLLVLGTHGRSGFERFVLGSVAEKVVRTASCPVLTVPRELAPSRPPAQFRRVLCALDLSPSSLLALDHAVSLVDAESGQLLLLHVIELPALLFGFSAAAIDVPGLCRGASDALDDLLRRVVPEGLRDRCRPEVVAGETRAYREALRLAREQSVDLIAMGVTGRGALDRLVFGSNASHVVRTAECPVLTVRSSPS